MWLLPNRLKFYETSERWIFAFLKIGDVTLFALEPLVELKGSENPYQSQAFLKAWAEVEAAVQPKISLFISVYERFLKLLQSVDFQSIEIGKEPYVFLPECIPTGKSAKGVRAARNQALRAGVQIEEYSAEKIRSIPGLREKMDSILHCWESRNLFKMGEFLNKVDPFTHMESRRYFFALSEEKGIEAFLVATAIPGQQSYFLEDMAIRPGATRGAGELLTLETMVALAESGGKFASLGVVALQEPNPDSAHRLPKPIEHIFITLPRLCSRFYNIGGLAMFRKRFKPQRWESVFLAVKFHPSYTGSQTLGWLKAIAALLRSFEPTARPTFTWAFDFIRRPLSRYPYSYFVLIASALSFILINHGSHLPQWALERFGFTSSAPFWEWPFRSMASDFLYFNRRHFYSSVILLFFLIRWAERSLPRKFVFWFLLWTSLLDDMVNQAAIIQPFRFFQPHIFERIASEKDVGGSLWIAALIGLMLCQLKKNRELYFSILSLGLISAISLNSTRYSVFLLNLNHFLFLTIGYMVGKLHFEHIRAVSRKNAKNKAPEAKSVRPQTPKQSENKSWVSKNHG